MRPIHTLIVDNNQKFAQALSAYLSLQPRLEVVGQATSWQEALARAAKLKCDLILADFKTSEISAPGMARMLKTLPAPPRVIVMAIDDSQAYHQAARDAGADGFVGKANISKELMPLIDALFKVRP